MSEPEDLVDALLGPRPLAALEALDLTDPSLQQVREVARQRLTAAPPGPQALQLLLAVSRFPGLSRAELADRSGLPAADVEPAARELLAKGLATSVRFGRGDCWSRTPAGAAAVRTAAS